MILLHALPFVAAIAAAPMPLPSEDRIVARSGTLQIDVELAHARPGGLLVVWLRPRGALGPTVASFEGRRAPVFSTPGGLRALVPLPVTTAPGSGTLGVEIRGRRGRRRVPVQVTISPVLAQQRTVMLSDDKQALLAHPSRVRDSRVVLGALRTLTPIAHWRGPIRPPVSGIPETYFGAQEQYVGAAFVPMLLDGTFGDQHRGLDYMVPTGTVVQAPAAGTVVLARALSLSGGTLVLDHGQGLLSVFFHLGTIDAIEGTFVEARSPVATSGETGLATAPHLHWGTYLHGVAVDPRILMSLPPGF